MFRVNYYEIEDKFLSFFEVDDNYNVLKGNIYTIERPGFLINIGWDSVQVGNDYYMVLSYPDFTGGSNSSHQVATSWLSMLTTDQFTAIKDLVKDSIILDAVDHVTPDLLKKVNKLLPDDVKVKVPGALAGPNPTETLSDLSKDNGPLT